MKYSALLVLVGLSLATAPSCGFKPKQTPSSTTGASTSTPGQLPAPGQAPPPSPPVLPLPNCSVAVSNDFNALYDALTHPFDEYTYLDLRNLVDACKPHKGTLYKCLLTRTDQSVEELELDQELASLVEAVEERKPCDPNFKLHLRIFTQEVKNKKNTPATLTKLANDFKAHHGPKCLLAHPTNGTSSLKDINRLIDSLMDFADIL